MYCSLHVEARQGNLMKALISLGFSLFLAHGSRNFILVCPQIRKLQQKRHRGERCRIVFGFNPFMRVSSCSDMGVSGFYTGLSCFIVFLGASKFVSGNTSGAIVFNLSFFKFHEFSHTLSDFS